MNRSAMAACAISLALSSGIALAQTPATTQALSRDALAQCAEHTLTLRSESDRLNRENAQMDRERESINQRGAALKQQLASVGKTDLDRGLALHEQRRQQREDAIAFNTRIEQHKQRIVALNQIKRDYDAQCAERPFRRADLETLTPAARDAMQRGLSDVQVPYLSADAATN
ncbi:hypothetical protein E4T66_05755 [Sinimarinibacterium sp. CAU 1509]|uniref:hypothetical protein n=1 Tax=Sinimarinibacterium sp. CAU 1509 TaxID=2562283 RepID=UPI0010AC0C95|nr:hypothetical protein [Sinimarinibacterium sp. CAU 1509]TJY63207.1 hypothetical protein E4T66_05755 [Sinimarinibacterium sp. CAU 1509]